MTKLPPSGMATSQNMEEYFARIQKDCFAALEIAKKAKALGYDPENEVSTTLASTLAQRVIGLISVIAPQLKGVGVEQRIEELEKQYGILDWRVSFVVAHEIAQQKFCAFKDEIEAITIGVRVGFAYHTLGVVSAPLEGLTNIEVCQRLDGRGKYFRLNFAGPIRNAGGTAAAVSVLIADYVRVQMGYDTYDPTEKEIMRCPAELADYHERITNLQYVPSEAESLFLMRNIPVEIGGDASEKFEITNAALKDLPRIPTNQLRSGYCLIHSSCIPLKGPKLWKQLEKWGASMGMEHWNFMKEFLDIQKKMKAAGKKATTGVKLAPDYTYLKDLVAGRPVLGYPLRSGSFRLRYGRSRVSGYSGQAIHPCTMLVLNNYIASATQLKVERPGKAAAFMPCDSIDGPVVRLKNGRVMRLNDEATAKAVVPEIERILYLGDVLINYGDFYNRNHLLIPVGYVPEWWIQEVEKSVRESTGEWSASSAEKVTGISAHQWEKIINNPISVFPTVEEAITIAKNTKTPLHSRWTPYWSQISIDDFKKFLVDIKPYAGGVRFGNTEIAKSVLEVLGVPHHIDMENHLIVPDQEFGIAIRSMLGLEKEGGLEDAITITERRLTEEKITTLAIISQLSPYPVRDTAGTFVGARMGRPEKAKMRKLTGSPHTLFPIGEEGGRLRSIQEALIRGKVTAEFPIRFCPQCKIQTVFGRCDQCDGMTEQQTRSYQRFSSAPVEEVTSIRQEIDIRRIFEGCLKKLEFKIYPDLIKGVRGTSNRSHIPEHLTKGILRAKHNIAVNKDGTTRYDCSEVTMTHFRPREVSVSVEKLREMGYEKDVLGIDLENSDQVLELKPQDIVIPCCPESPDEPSDEVLFRVTKFIDELLKKLYGMPAFYKLKTKEELVGQYVVGLAPHTSAGIVGRIVGFSKTQGFLAHPLYHAAMRRDCDGDESCFVLLMDTLLNFSSKFLAESRGSTMDAPLVLTYLLNPAEVDDMAFHVDRVWKYPLEMYELASNFKSPYDIKLSQIGDVLGKPEQFEGMGFTHDTHDINAGVLCSAYKTLPSMQEKLFGQMDLAKKIRACDPGDVARLVIEKHFIRDIKGNLRKFTQQEYRCVKCNDKFRRPPLIGKCTSCNGKIVFTISEGSVIKYLEPSLSIANEFPVPAYLKHDLELLRRKIEDLFGKDKETQTGLGQWFG